MTQHYSKEKETHKSFCVLFFWWLCRHHESDRLYSWIEIYKYKQLGSFFLYMYLGMRHKCFRFDRNNLNFNVNIYYDRVCFDLYLLCIVHFIQVFNRLICHQGPWNIYWYLGKNWCQSYWQPYGGNWFKCCSLLSQRKFISTLLYCLDL